ncbi:MAG TPA: hypothetical protein VKT73_11165 [Xanthobacteraceae bacterium]|nr:hypothetical protein [Xanthobacteraceae bacterium]
MLINFRKVLTMALAVILLGIAWSLLLPKTAHSDVAYAGPGNLGASDVVPEDAPASELAKVLPANPLAPNDRHLEPFTDDDLD